MSLIRPVALLALALLAGGALAQPKPALVQDRDEPGRAPYQSRTDSPVCPVPNSCYLSFSSVPAGHRLVITYMSINYYLDPLASSHVFLGNGVITVRLAGPAPDFASDSRTISAPVTLYVEPGNSPSVSFVASNDLSGMTATLVGYLVNLP